MSSPTAGNDPLSPEALYELKLDTVRRFVNYLHLNDMFITTSGDTAGIDITQTIEGFLEQETIYGVVRYAIDSGLLKPKGETK